MRFLVNRHTCNASVGEDGIGLIPLYLLDCLDNYAESLLYLPCHHVVYSIAQTLGHKDIAVSLRFHVTHNPFRRHLGGTGPVDNSSTEVNVKFGLRHRQRHSIHFSCLAFGIGQYHVSRKQGTHHISNPDNRNGYGHDMFVSVYKVIAQNPRFGL